MLSAAGLALILTGQLAAQTAPQPISPLNSIGVTAPAQAFKQEPGSDYFLANYDAYEAYLKTVAAQSNRIKLFDIGKSAEGRTMWVAAISSPENLAKLDHYRSIAQRLAKAEGLTDDQARELAREGRAVVWIDAGLHATEVITTQSQIHVIYRMLTNNDPETMRILENDIVLFGHDNPDGLQLVANWYMQNEDKNKREYNFIPRLYHKYIGHDNNRDSFMSQMPETTNLNKIFFREWYPQIIYNQHQTGPAGMVVFVPPFRDPFNYNYDPLLITQLEEVGSSIHSRLISEGKAGSGMRDAANYSTWHNGMVRSTSYFHNSIGLLTEIIGGPTPQTIPLIPEVQLPAGDRPLPIKPQEWHMYQSLEYQWSMDRAVMDYAARNRERLLFNIYRMGSDAIARGNKDSWTTTPNAIAALEEAAKKSPKPEAEESYDPRMRGKIDPALYDSVLHDPARRDPRGYVMAPGDQRDMPTLIAFLNTLIKNGVDVMRATAPFTVGSKNYPAGSFVVKTNQAYRPHVLDMFEPQNHPNNLEYPGGPPKAPYDITGYNLSYQMGIGYDRILDGFEGPFEKVPDLLAPPPGQVIGKGGAGWVLRHETNNSFILTNRLLKAGVKVAWLTGGATVGGQTFGPGAIWVPASSGAASIITAGAKTLGIDAYAADAKPVGATLALKPVRIGLVDQYGGVMPAGWTRWLFEQFEFPYKVVYPQELDAGNLNRKYDVLVFANGTVPAAPDGPWRGRASRQPAAEEIPAEFRPWLGLVTAEKTVPQLNAFTKAGGTIVAVGSAAQLGSLMGTPVSPALVKTENGKTVALSTREFYIPGSLIAAKVDPTQPLAYGMPTDINLFFDHSQSFNVAPGANSARRVSWYDSATPLRSGWALGQEKLNGTNAIVDVDMGRGKLFILGPEVTQRAQPYVTFKFLFNGLLYGPAAAAAR